MTLVSSAALPTDHLSAGGLTSVSTASTPSLRAFEDAFASALQNTGASQPVANGDPLRIAQVDTGTRVDAPNPLIPLPPITTVETGATDTGSAGDRAAAALGLERETAGTPGDAILTGLEQLRSVFDRSLVGVSNIAESGAVMDIGQMVQLQAQVTQFSLLVDVSSKLAGKSTQAMDSLMKGQ